MLLSGYRIPKAPLIMALILFLCGANLYAQKWGKVSDAEWQIGAPEDCPEANAIILFNNGVMEVTPNYIELTQHIRIKILNKAGIDEVGDQEITYFEDDKLKWLKAQTITPDGEKHPVDKKEIYTKEVGRWRTKTFAFPNLDSGVIVEYRFVNQNERWWHLDPWYFQAKLYTLYSQFVLKLHPGFNYSSATMNVPSNKQQPVEETIGTSPYIVAYTWELDHLPPVKDEPYMSFAKNYIAAIYNQLVSYRGTYETYTYIKNWQDLGEGRQEYIDQMIKKEKKIKELTDSLIAGINSPRKKAEAIYKYVCGEIKTWVDPEDNRFLGEKRLWEFIEQGHASRNGKNLLLAQMLKSAGLNAWPVYIGERDESIFVPQLCQLEQFERYIVLIEIDTLALYLDAASKYLPFGILSPNSRMSGGLKIDGKNSMLVRVFQDNPNTARKDMTDMYISREGVARCSTTVMLNGYYAYSFGERYDDCDDQEKFVEDFFFDDFDGEYTIDSQSVEILATDSIRVTAFYTLSDFTRTLDNNLLVKQLQFRYTENPFKNASRSFPVDFNYPFRFENSMRLTFDDTLTSYTLPEKIDLQIQGASYNRSCMFDGTSVVLQNRLDVEIPVFLQPQYASLRDFFIQIASASEDEFVLSY